jgi:4-carboxymuconolactone decarboxylase
MGLTAGPRDNDKEKPVTAPNNHEAIPRRTAADTSGEVSRVLAKLEASGKNLTIVRLLANDPALLRPFVLLSGALLNDAVLPAEVREVVILWLAQRNRSTYEWAEHEIMGAQAGLSPELIDSLRRGKLDGASRQQRLAVEIVGELVESRKLSGQSWQSAQDTWGLAGAFDLVLSVGWWHGLVPVVIDALGLEVPDNLRDTPLPRFD